MEFAKSNGRVETENKLIPDKIPSQHDSMIQPIVEPIITSVLPNKNKKNNLDQLKNKIVEKVTENTKASKLSNNNANNNANSKDKVKERASKDKKDNEKSLNKVKKVSNQEKEREREKIEVKERLKEVQKIKLKQNNNNILKTSVSKEKPNSNNNNYNNNKSNNNSKSPTNNLKSQKSNALPNLYTNAFGKAVNNQNLLNEIKLNLQKNIEKLKDTATRDAGYREIKLMINRYTHQTQISLFISHLTKFNKSLSKGTKEYMILLLGYLASTQHEYFSKYEGIKLLVNGLNNYFQESSEIIHKTISFSYLECFKSFFFQQNLDYDANANIQSLDNVFKINTSNNSKEGNLNNLNLNMMNFSFNENNNNNNNKDNKDKDRSKSSFNNTFITLLQVFFNVLVQFIDEYLNHHTNYRNNKNNPTNNNNNNNGDGTYFELNDATYNQALVASEIINDFSKFCLIEKSSPSKTIETTDKTIVNRALLQELILISVYDNISFKFTKISKNTKIILPCLYESLSYIMEIFGVEYLYSRNSKALKAILDHIIEILSINDSKIYFTKIECCLFLNKLFSDLYAIKFRKTEEKGEKNNGEINNLIKLVVDEKSNQLRSILEYSCKDRVVKVQNSANIALKNYLELLHDEDNKRKSVDFRVSSAYLTNLKDSKFLSIVYTNNNQIESKGRMSKLNVLRQISKNNKVSSKNDLLSMTSMNMNMNFNKDNGLRSSIFERGVSSLLTTNNFMSKNRYFSKDNLKSKSYDAKRRDLKRFIKDQYSNLSKTKQGRKHRKQSSMLEEMEVEDKTSSFSIDDDAIYYVDMDTVKRYKEGKVKKKKEIKFDEEDLNADNLEVNPPIDENSIDEDGPCTTNNEGNKEVKDYTNLKDFLSQSLKNFMKKADKFENDINGKLKKLNKRVDVANGKINDYNNRSKLDDTVAYSMNLEMENPLIYLWTKAIKLLGKEKYNQAFEVVYYEMQDDLYLIRFCILIVKYSLGNLNSNYCCLLIKRLLKLLNGEKVKIVFSNFITICNKRFPKLFDFKNEVESKFKNNKKMDILKFKDANLNNSREIRHFETKDKIKYNSSPSNISYANSLHESIIDINEMSFNEKCNKNTKNSRNPNTHNNNNNFVVNNNRIKNNNNNQILDCSTDGSSTNQVREYVSFSETDVEKILDVLYLLTDRRDNVGVNSLKNYLEIMKINGDLLKPKHNLLTNTSNMNKNKKEKIVKSKSKSKDKLKTRNK